jgi:hypothetical protein
VAQAGAIWTLRKDQYVANQDLGGRGKGDPGGGGGRRGKREGGRGEGKGGEELNS